MADDILPTLDDIADNIEGAAYDLEAGIALMRDVVGSMSAYDSPAEMIEAQGKLIFLLKNLPDAVKEILLESKRLACFAESTHQIAATAPEAGDAGRLQ